MSIRESENELFKKWAKKYPDSTFLIDGCPNPKVYELEKRKVIFVLKDGNLGESPETSIYDQRKELEFNPHPWWETIALWCYLLKNYNASWLDAKTHINSQEKIRNELSCHCFIQLKKESGIGSVSNDTLYQAIENDKEEIIKQLGIYSPDFIVACGNGDQISSMFDLSTMQRKETIFGVGYWKVNVNRKDSCLIDYCHPSIRVGTKVKGLIAKGLSAAIMEIEEK